MSGEFPIPDKALAKLAERGQLDLGVETPEPEPEEREYQPTARARRTDPPTSHEAAASIPTVTLRESQAAVLQAFAIYGPMNDEQLQVAYAMGRTAKGWPRQSESGLRTRRRELVDRGLLEDTGETMLLPSGRRSIVWGSTAR